MNENWDFYFCLIEERAASVLLDLALGDLAPIAEMPVLIWVQLAMNHPREDGLSSNEEVELLGAVEEALVSALDDPFEARLVGKVTSGGRRDFYFYAPADPDAPDVSKIPEAFRLPPKDPEAGQVTTENVRENVAAAMARFPIYTYDCGAMADPEWKVYREFLYPTSTQKQIMMNQRVLETLSAQGDPLTTPRQVLHLIRFDSKNARRRFVQKVHELGYEIGGEPEELPPLESHPLSLLIGRVSSVDAETINAQVLELHNLATSESGIYDGWETEVVKPDETTDSNSTPTE